MNKEEMICKNCKYHYIEEISFDYPQSCCEKRKAVIEEWFNCNDFEYDDRYIEQLQQENDKLKEQLEDANEKIILLQASEPMLNYKKTLEETQQKEFIKYLEDKIYSIEPKGTGINYNCEYDSEEDYVMAMQEQSRLNTLKEILQKYKEIIGGKDV